MTREKRKREVGKSERYPGWSPREGQTRKEEAPPRRVRRLGTDASVKEKEERKKKRRKERRREKREKRR